MDTDTATVVHRITWWAWVAGKRVRRSGPMRTADGFDVACSCGQQSGTGGATEANLRRRVWWHKEFGTDLSSDR